MWWLSFTLAFARPTVEEAEMRRVSEELDKLATRNQWPGVERSYLSLATLAADHGLLLTHEQHLLGAAAAAARGDVQEQWRRLLAAQKAERRLETQGQIAVIEATHGKVTLTISPFVKNTPILEVLDPPGPSDQRTIDAVRQQITDRRRFEGLLPLGRYRLGGLTFDIDGGPPQSHTVTSATAVVAEGPETLTLAAAAPPSAPDVFVSGMAAALEALRAIPGIASVEIHAPSPEVTHLDFDASQLDALGSTPTQLARGVQDGLGLPEGTVIARPTSLVLRQEVDPVLVTSLHVPIPGGSIGLLALASLRKGPDGFAPPPGVSIALAPGADRDQVMQAAKAALAASRGDWFAAP